VGVWAALFSQGGKIYFGSPVLEGAVHALGWNIMTVGASGGGCSSLLGAGSKEKEEGTGDPVQASNYVPNGLLPPVGTHLPKFPQPPQIVLPAGDQAFKT
jgi:hypothetical protein